MDTFFAIILAIMFIPIMISAYRLGTRISQYRADKRAERYVELGAYTAQRNHRAVQNVRERNGW